MKKKNIYMINTSFGYFYKKGKYTSDISKAKRYKTFNGVFKLYNELIDVDVADSITIEYEVFKTRKVGRVVHEKTDYMGEYDLSEYYAKEKEKAEILNHEVNIIDTLKKEVETKLSTDDSFWE